MANGFLPSFTPTDVSRFFWDRTALGGTVKLYRTVKGFDINNNGFSDWLYGDWSEEKYNQYLALNSVYPIHLYMDYLLDRRSTGEYLNRYGLDYTDIHDPRKLASTRSGTAIGSYALNMVSKNVGKLYR